MGLRDDQRIYPFSAQRFGEDIRWLCSGFGFHDSRLTPYALRRGGATWHFLAFGSLEATAVLGRWQHMSTARLYIEGAASEYASWKLTDRGERLCDLASKVAQQFFSIPSEGSN